MLQELAHRCEKAAIAKQKQEGRKHLHTSIRFYRKQHAAGRYFLHEHPWPASSWKEDCVLEIWALPEVEVVRSSMCRFLMKVFSEVQKDREWGTTLAG